MGITPASLRCYLLVIITIVPVPKGAGEDELKDLSEHIASAVGKWRRRPILPAHFNQKIHFLTLTAVSEVWII